MHQLFDPGNTGAAARAATQRSLELRESLVGGALAGGQRRVDAGLIHIHAGTDLRRPGRHGGGRPGPRGQQQTPIALHRLLVAQYRPQPAASAGVAAEQKGIPLVACNLNENVASVFTISGFDRIVPLHDTLEAAVAALSGD